MSIIEIEHHVDKQGWKDGPWMNEPDKLNWITEAGLDGMIVRNCMGALCGYVAVAEGHPYFQVPYQKVASADVHGGLTYSSFCGGHICHTPEPGRPDDVWWLGFDCGHMNDYLPGMEANMRKIPELNTHDLWSETTPEELANLKPGEHMMARTYKHLEYVKAEVEQLARQLVDGPHDLYKTPYGFEDDDTNPAEIAAQCTEMLADIADAVTFDTVASLKQT